MFTRSRKAHVIPTMRKGRRCHFTFLTVSLWTCNRSSELDITHPPSFRLTPSLPGNQRQDI